jgi:hypothetical protein
MATEIEMHATELLEQLYDHTGHEQETVTGFLEARSLEMPYGFELIELLEGSGFIQSSSGYGAPSGLVTARGRQAIQQLRADRDDPKVRVQNLREAMLTWLQEQRDRNANPSGWDAFVATAGTEEAGAYTERQIKDQAEYLYEHALIKAVKSWGAPDGWNRPELTVAGRTCLTDFGGDVTAYLNQGQPAPSITTSTVNNNTYVTDNHGNITTGGEQITQSVTNNTGLDVTEILELAGGADQLAAVLGLSTEVEPEFLESAQLLHAEASSDAPDRGRMRQLVDKLRDGALSAAPTVAQKTILALADQALQALNGG